jgi:hypothetical protein
MHWVSRMPPARRNRKAVPLESGQPRKRERDSGWSRTTLAAAGHVLLARKRISDIIQVSSRDIMQSFE